MKTTWDNEESDQRKALTKMLENMKELIKEQEEKNSNAFEARQLSVLETYEMAKVLCDNIGGATECQAPECPSDRVPSFECQAQPSAQPTECLAGIECPATKS